MLSPSTQIGIGLAIVVATMTALWFVQRRTGNAGIVDVAWAASIGALSILFCATSNGYDLRRLLVAAAIGIWSVRLTTYLAFRVIGEEEDGRYAELRKKWGDKVQFKMFGFFQMQAAVALAFALPILVASRNEALLGFWDAAGGIVWLLGVGGVALSDWQLKQFRENSQNRGKTCRRGLWRYSRHPNYFFEWLHWWAYPCFAVGAAFWWLTPIVPLVLLYFLLFVTGIPPTEKQAVASRGEDYRKYQRTTNAFIPWFPKKEIHAR